MQHRRLWWVIGVVVLAGAAAHAETEEPQAPSAAPSPKAVEAMQLLQSSDTYQQQLGFLRLEALRELSTVPAIQQYVTSKNPDTRAYSLRALAAIQTVAAVPLLLETLRREKDTRVRRAALLGLEPLVKTDPAILPVLIQALRDRRVEIRIAAIDIVSRIDDPRARQAILVRNQRERQRGVRRVLVMAMNRMAHE